MSRRYVFVGEKRSRRAIAMAVSWADGRLAGRTLHEALRAAALDPAEQLYLNAFVDGDGTKACSLMTNATRRQFVEKTKAITKSADCSLAIEAIRTQAGAEVTAALAKLKFTNVKVTGNRATVTLESGGSKTTATLMKEGGAWKVSGAPGT